MLVNESQKQMLFGQQQGDDADDDGDDDDVGDENIEFAKWKM